MKYSVPFFMGNRLQGLDVPRPHRVIAPDLPAGSEMERMAVLYQHVADAVFADDDPVLYCGDCCSILGVIPGLQRRGIDPVLVFFDAHGDFNTWETTPSNFIGGMPLAMVTGRGDQTIVEGCGVKLLAESDIFIVDGRDLDPAEAEMLADSDVAIVPVANIAAAVPSDRPLYVHVDTDVVDPGDMPALNYPAPDGPSADAVARAVANLAATGNVVAFSLTTWNPELAGAVTAAAASHRIAAPFLG
jgi:arginase